MAIPTRLLYFHQYKREIEMELSIRFESYDGCTEKQRDPSFASLLSVRPLFPYCFSCVLYHEEAGRYLNKDDDIGSAEPGRLVRYINTVPGLPGKRIQPANKNCEDMVISKVLINKAHLMVFCSKCFSLYHRIILSNISQKVLVL